MWLRLSSLLYCLLHSGCLLGAVPKVQAELFSDVISVPKDTPFKIAMRLNIPREWHLYWKNPGDSGLATGIQWTLPSSVRAGDILWPTPERFESKAGVTYGYRTQATLLVPFLISETCLEKKVPIEALGKWLLCSKEQCVPGKEKLEVSIQVGDPVWSSHRKGIEDSEKTLPKSMILRAFSKDHTVVLNLPPTFRGEILFFPSTQGEIDNASTRITSTIDGLFPLKIDRSHTGVVKTLSGVLVKMENNKVKESLWVSSTIQ